MLILKIQTLAWHCSPEIVVAYYCTVIIFKQKLIHLVGTSGKETAGRQSYFCIFCLRMRCHCCVQRIHHKSWMQLALYKSDSCWAQMNKWFDPCLLSDTFLVFPFSSQCESQNTWGSSVPSNSVRNWSTFCQSKFHLPEMNIRSLTHARIILLRVSYLLLKNVWVFDTSGEVPVLVHMRTCVWCKSCLIVCSRVNYMRTECTVHG